MNHLYYGDNLEVLRGSVADESVDLIYLDPPFNSKRDYNLLFKSPKGQASEAQISAFLDSWHWGAQAEAESDALRNQPNTNVTEMMYSLISFLGRNDMTAYLVMMASRLLQMHRVLKAHGSLYLHCDPVAAHYLKILLDAVFGATAFRSEIIWKRTSAHSNVYRSFGDITDTIFFYAKGPDFVWNQLYRRTDLEAAFPQVDERGRRWRSENLRNPGVRPNLTYAYTASNGVTYQPHANGWTISLEKMKKLDADGRLHFPAKAEGRLRLRLYADESPGIKLQNLWDDIPPIGSQAAERLGYPTQKPLALLERILLASSNEGNVVLDPFCGCGTAVHAAQKLGRKWIGIDITHLAISLIEKRLKDAFYDKAKTPEEQEVQFAVHGTPKDLAGARHLARLSEHDGRYQFQWWAVSLVEAQPFQGRKKGADKGIDGVKYFHDTDNQGARKAIVSVKSGKLKPDDVRALNHVRERETAELAFLIALEPPTPGMVTDAASAGFYTSATGKRYPRLQLLTLEGLLAGTERAEHPDAAPVNFKQVKKETSGKQRELL